MGKIIFRSAVSILAIALFIVSVLVLSWSCMPQKIYHGETYLKPGFEYTIAVHKNSKVTFSGECKATEVESANPNCINLYDGFLSDAQEKYYLITGDAMSKCQVSITGGKGDKNKTNVYDLIFYSPIDSVERLRFCEYTYDDLQEVSRTGEWRDGLHVLETVTLTFGGAYEMIDLNTENVFDGNPLSSFDTVHFEAYNDSDTGADPSLTLDASGNIVVLGTQSGYFKYYSELSGGFIVPYVIDYEDVPVVDIIISSYQKAYGKALKPSDITPSIINSLTVLETDRFPTYLSESMFSSVFPNVSALIVNLESDLDENVKCFVPESLHMLQVVNNSEIPHSANVSFYGEGASAAISLIGNVAINGNGSDPTFSGFDKLELYANSEVFGSWIYISSQDGNETSPDAQDVFNNITTLNIDARDTFLNISAGRGAAYVGEFSAGNGGTAIDCVYLELTHNQSVYIYGGAGGDGKAGSRGQDGDDGVNNGIFNGTKGEDGTDGGHGKNGGKGGAAVNAKQVVFRSDYFPTLTLKGGKGGNGGDGGDGGNGGKGCAYIIGREDDGRGGKGGNGGNGGESGYGLAAAESLGNYTNLKVIESGFGKAGYFGLGGSSRDYPGEFGDFYGTKGESLTWIVHSGVVNGSEPVETEN